MTPDSPPSRSAPANAGAPPPCPPAERTAPGPSTDFMILPDGTIYARNLTPDLAAILATLNPHDSAMALRASTIPPSP